MNYGHYNNYFRGTYHYHRVSCCVRLLSKYNTLKIVNNVLISYQSLLTVGCLLYSKSWGAVVPPALLVPMPMLIPYSTKVWLQKTLVDWYPKRFGRKNIGGLAAFVLYGSV